MFFILLTFVLLLAWPIQDFLGNQGISVPYWLICALLSGATLGLWRILRKPGKRRSRRQRGRAPARDRAEAIRAKGARGERRLIDTLRRAGIEVIPDLYVQFPGGNRVVQQLDAVVRLPDGIVLIENKDWAGEIRVDAEGGWSHNGAAISSPLAQNVRHLEVMRQAVDPNFAWQTLVVMTDAMPRIARRKDARQVVHIDQVIRRLKQLGAPSSRRQTAQVWAKIVSLARNADEQERLRRLHRSQGKTKVA